MSPNPPTEEALVDHCINHLETEYKTLVDFNATLQGIALALRNHNLKDLQRLVLEKEHQMQLVQMVREQRQTIRAQISLAMPTEGEVSIASWAESLDDVPRRTILDLRNRLLNVARQTRQQAQINQVVVARGVQLLNQALDCLSGHNATSERYSAEGRLVGQRPSLPFPNPAPLHFSLVRQDQ